MLVREIMTTDIETLTREASLYRAVELMLREEIDHVIVTEDGSPAGVVTRRKVLVATYKTDSPLSEIPLSTFARGFEITVEPTRTVLLSVGHLQGSNADCLPVVDDLDVVGVLTKDDILDNVSNIKSETLEAEKRGREWTAGEDDRSTI